MIRYAYNSQVTPPAPFVLVSLRDPTSGAEVRDVPALIDTGADSTVLPRTIVEKLALPVISGWLVTGFMDSQVSVPVYAVELGVHNLPMRDLQVISHEDDSRVILSRDILNTHRILLDGPNLKLELL